MSTPSVRTKAGTSRASAAQKKAAFVEAYLSNGGNGTQAAITAGYTARSAYSTASRLLKDAEVHGTLESRQKELQAKHRLTTDRVLQELARVSYFDVRKLYNPDGTLKSVHELDDDTAAAIAALDIEDGKIVKVRAADKNSALEKAARVLGLYKADMAPLVPLQAPSTAVNLTVTLSPSEALLRMLGRGVGAHAR